MTFDVLWQSALANVGLLLVYVAYKFCARVAGSKCHYTRDHGLEIHLPDPDDPVDLEALNQIFANRGMSMRIRDAGTA
jgi:hypothetical protein